MIWAINNYISGSEKRQIGTFKLKCIQKRVRRGISVIDNV
jgi:hypothetical protein